MYEFKKIDIFIEVLSTKKYCNSKIVLIQFQNLKLRDFPKGIYFAEKNLVSNI